MYQVITLIANILLKSELLVIEIHLFSTDPAHLGATPTAPGGGATATASAGDNKVPQLTIDGTPHLPFQLQIEYTSQDGSRCTRVISQAKPTTKQREVAEKG